MEESLRARKSRQAREHVAATALRLFVERGFDNVTAAEIARTADVGQSTFFAYFGSKEDAALLDLHRELEVFAAIAADRQPGDTLADVCRAAGQSRIALASDDPQRVRMRLALAAATPAIRIRATELRREAEQRHAAPIVVEELACSPDDLRVTLALAVFTGLSDSLDDVFLAVPDERGARDIIEQAATTLAAAIRALR